MTADTGEAGDRDQAEIEASRAPLITHLAELRRRLIVVFAALLAIFVLGFLVSRPVFDLLVLPFENVTEGREFRFIYTGPLEFFIVQLKIAFYIAIGFGFPVAAWQAYAFVAPGLYRSERRAVAPFLIAAPVLFTAGSAVAYFGVFPVLAEFALSFESSGEDGRAAVEHLPRVSEYIAMEAALVTAFGLGFQLPVAIGLLARAGLVSARTLRRGRKYAVVGVFAFAAFATPPDPLSQFALAIPVYLLYELSIWVARLARPKHLDDAT